ncbi:nucleotidyltransferase [Nitrospinae bacterium AH_259_B05_G02_I21]|nr:nucleotidyltransferase [Nitrospinae bacterium AH_259_B05_G02_I21]
MTEPLISHTKIKAFAEERVNLPSETAKKHRVQVNGLRERLEAHIAANPGFALVKMLHAGSVAKGTALRTINDLDVAVYVKKDEAPMSDEELVPWLATRLREANPNMKPEQFDDSQPHCVTVRFRGTGLDVDVVPVLYEGDEHDLGYLIAKDTGERTLTSIPLHLEFIRTRKKAHPDHFAQVVRLVKWWVNQQKDRDTFFRCKSFMVELIVAHLADRGVILSDYPTALEGLFSYMVRTGLQERIAFTDYFATSELPPSNGTPIEIFDPVNPSNNIASRYTTADLTSFVDAAEQAADAISEAHYATTKGRAVECWQIVLGPSFRG